MRTNFVLSLILLAAVLALSFGEQALLGSLAQGYVSAAEELAVMTRDGDWTRAEETLFAYAQRWESAGTWMQVLCEHQDIDAVDNALKSIAAGIQSRDVPLSLEACGVLRAAADHIARESLFTWGNVL